MKNINVIVLDVNQYSLEDLLKSPYLTLKNVEEIERIKNTLTKKEKAGSFILKNKFIGSYSVNDFNKPISPFMHFNVSHSFGLVVLAINNKDIGIDVELIREVDPSLVVFVTSEEEKKHLNGPESFFKIWTSKESLLKCLGLGIRKKLSEISSIPFNGLKEYDGETFYSQITKYRDYIVSITIQGDEEFDINFKEESL